MSVTGVKKMNWFPKTSAWQQSQAWRQRQQASADRVATLGALQEGFSTAAQNQSAGIAQLSLQMATDRLQASAQAKIDLLK